MTYPSFLYICIIVTKVCLYVVFLIGSWVLMSDATWGCGPWMRLFATSNGMLKQDAIVPAINPNVNWNIHYYYITAIKSWNHYSIIPCTNLQSNTMYLFTKLCCRIGKYWNNVFNWMIKAKVDHVEYSVSPNSCR